MHTTDGGCFQESANFDCIKPVCFPRFTDGKLLTKLASYTENIDRLGICGRVVATDAVRDLALIELSSVPEDALALRPTASGCQPGEVFHSLTNYLESERLWSCASGRVRSVRRIESTLVAGAEQVSFVEVAVPLLPRSCGPVVNAQGELVGFFDTLIRNRLLDTFVDISEIRRFLRGATLP